MLQINPLLKEEDGRIEFDRNVSGRQMPLHALAEIFGKTVADAVSQTIGSATGCERNAFKPRDMIAEKLNLDSERLGTFLSAKMKSWKDGKQERPSIKKQRGRLAALNVVVLRIYLRKQSLQ